MSKFNQVCLSFNLHLTREELRRLAKISHEGRALDSSYQISMDSLQNNVNYVQLSKALGLHKASLDQIQQSNQAFNQLTQRRIMETLNPGMRKSARQLLTEEDSTYNR